MKIKALNNYVAGIHLENPNKEGDIFLIDKDRRQRWIKVVSAGKGVQDYNGQLVENVVSEGDVVYASAHGQLDFNTKQLGEEVNYIMVSELDILCKYEDSKVKPLHALVMVEKLQQDTLEKVGDIMLPEFASFPNNIGKVVAMGNGMKLMNGENMKMDIQVGDLVIYNPFAEQTVDLSLMGSDGKAFLVPYGEIIAKVEN